MMAIIQTKEIPGLLDELNDIDNYSAEEARGLALELGAACRTLLREKESTGEAMRKIRRIYDELVAMIRAIKT
jgi:hypothetical protein